MARKLKMKRGDQEVEVQEADFKIVSEDWNEYQLLDGGKVRVKTIVTKIYQALDASGQPVVSDMGEPELLISHKTEVVGSI